MTMLIVDDNEEVRRLLKSLLADLVETVYECDDGAQALALYTAHCPDWVLMDLQMKTMDGLTATRQIRACFPDARIVMVTQYNSPALRAEATQAGVVGYVNKEDLLELRDLLSKPQPHYKE